MISSRKLLQAAAGVGGVGGWISVASTSSYSDTAKGVAVDSSGNIIAVSTSTTPSQKIMIAKYDADGDILWSRVIQPNNAGSQSQDVAVDSSDNIIVVGWGVLPSPSTDNIGFIAKYNSSGVFQWDKKFEPDVSSTNCFIYGVTTDGSDNIYMCGDGKNGGRGLLVKYNSSGTVQWKVATTSPTILDYTAVAVNSSGEVFACGIADNRGILSKYNSSGVHQWTVRQTKGTRTTKFWDIAFDSSGNIILAGEIDYPSNRPVVTKYNSSGVLQWSSYISNISEDSFFRAVAVNSDDEIFLCGQARQSSDNQLLAAKCSSAGSFEWTNTINDTTSVSAYGFGAAIHEDGSFIACGGNSSLVAKLFSDGSGAGTYGNISYVSESYTTGAAPDVASAAFSVTSSSFSGTSTDVTSGEAAITLTQTLAELS
mgnify:FL=1